MTLLSYIYNTWSKHSLRTLQIHISLQENVVHETHIAEEETEGMSGPPDIAEVQ